MPGSFACASLFRLPTVEPLAAISCCCLAPFAPPAGLDRPEAGVCAADADGDVDSILFTPLAGLKVSGGGGGGPLDDGSVRHHTGRAHLHFLRLHPTGSCLRSRPPAAPSAAARLAASIELHVSARSEQQEDTEDLSDQPELECDSWQLDDSGSASDADADADDDDDGDWLAEQLVEPDELGELNEETDEVDRDTISWQDNDSDELDGGDNDRRQQVVALDCAVGSAHWRKPLASSDCWR